MSYAVANLLVSIIDIFWWVLLVTVVMSWLIAFDVINMRSKAMYTIWNMANTLTEPLLGPIRNLLPAVGGLDISPLILLLILQFLRDWIVHSATSVSLG